VAFYTLAEGIMISVRDLQPELPKSVPIFLGVRKRSVTLEPFEKWNRKDTYKASFVSKCPAQTLSISVCSI